MLGLDLDPDLVAAFNERAAELPAEAEPGNARDFSLGGEFGLVLAPMQLVQLFADAGERIECLRCVAGHLEPGGRAALAIVERAALDGTNLAAGGAAFDAAPPPLPDACEVDGWVYSSLPLETAVGEGEIVVRRLRQTVSPDGELGEAVNEVRLRALDATTVEREAKAAGLRPAGRRAIPATEAHVGSTVVLLEKEA